MPLAAGAPPIQTCAVQVLVDRAADSTDSTVEPEQAPGLYGEIAKRVESGHGEPREHA